MEVSTGQTGEVKRLQTQKANTPLLGIRGDMGAGKDTLAAEIQKLHPAYRVWKFAAGLREAVRIITDIPAEQTVSDIDKAVDLSARKYRWLDLLGRIDSAVEHITGHASREGLAETMSRILTGVTAGSAEESCIPMTVGRLLQVLGTECFRAHIGPDVWVDYLFMRWEREGRPPVVIADTRFPNESAAIRRRGGAVILVRREAAKRTDGRSTGHASERALDGEAPDVTLDNDGTIADLGKALEGAWPGIRQIAGERLQ